jgi:hypothetical protein
MNLSQRLKEMEEYLLKLDAERISITREIQSIKNQIVIESKERVLLLGRSLAKKEILTNADKVQMFLQLFAGRLDVYPRRWENNKTEKPKK